MYDDIAGETGMAMNTLREYKHISEAVKSDVRTSDSSFNNKVKDFTGSLNGKPFEDENGEVVKSFKELIATWLKSVKK